MKVAIIGSRNADKSSYDDLLKAIPIGASEIISGGADGADLMAKQYAEEYHLKFTEILPNYKKYGKNATLVRNNEIVEYSDYVIAVWDGISKGTGYVIDQCIKKYTPVKVVYFGNKSL